MLVQAGAFQRFLRAFNLRERGAERVAPRAARHAVALESDQRLALPEADELARERPPRVLRTRFPVRRKKGVSGVFPDARDVRREAGAPQGEHAPDSDPEGCRRLCEFRARERARHAAHHGERRAGEPARSAAGAAACDGGRGELEGCARAGGTAETSASDPKHGGLERVPARHNVGDVRLEPVRDAGARALERGVHHERCRRRGQGCGPDRRHRGVELVLHASRAHTAPDHVRRSRRGRRPARHAFHRLLRPEPASHRSRARPNTDNTDKKNVPVTDDTSGAPEATGTFRLQRFRGKREWSYYTCIRTGVTPVSARLPSRLPERLVRTLIFPRSCVAEHHVPRVRALRAGNGFVGFARRRSGPGAMTRDALAALGRSDALRLRRRCVIASDHEGGAWHVTR